MSNAKTELWQIHEWETAFFGVLTARITVSCISIEDLDRVLAECQASGVRVVHYLADANDDDSILAAERAGFHLVDVRMTLEWNASMESGVTQTDLVLRDYRVGDLPRLEEIARTIPFIGRLVIIMTGTIHENVVMISMLSGLLKVVRVMQTVLLWLSRIILLLVSLRVSFPQISRKEQLV